MPAKKPKTAKKVQARRFELEEAPERDEPAPAGAEAAGAPAWDSLFTKVKLFTCSGGFVADILMPPYGIGPELLIWGQRFFIRRGDNTYRESEFSTAVWTKDEHERMHGKGQAS